MRLRFAAALCAAFVAAPAYAATTGTIDFEGFGDNEAITSLTVAGVQVDVSAFRNSNDAERTVIGFDTERDISNDPDPDLLFPHGGGAGAASFGMIAVVRERDGTDGYDTVNGPANDRRKGLPVTLRFAFERDIDFVSLDAFDFGDTNGSPNLEIFLDGDRVFADGPLTDGISGDSMMEAFLADRVYTGSTLDLVFKSSGGIDNIKINVVPVPAGAVLLLSGLGLAAGVRRLRNRKA